jgi:hypothetical protein
LRNALKTADLRLSLGAGIDGGWQERYNSHSGSCWTGLRNSPLCFEALHPTPRRYGDERQRSPTRHGHQA